MCSIGERQALAHVELEPAVVIDVPVEQRGQPLITSSVTRSDHEAAERTSWIMNVLM
jgi:hypothetical protein